MLKKTINYKDYNGEERSEDCYFNLSRAEVTEMELTTEGGLSEMIQGITRDKNVPKIIEVFKMLILKSYGKKSPDGRRFIKSAELSEEFSQTEAYSELFMELATNASSAAAFVNGIMPVESKIPDSKLEIIE